MFLRSSLDLASVSLLANPQLKTPFLYPENHRNILPSCPGKEQPRDTIDGGSNVVYASHGRGSKNRPNFSVKEKSSPVCTRLHLRRKPNQRKERRFLGPPSHALCAPKLGKENPAKFFREGKLFPARTEFHMRCNTNVTRETLFLLTVTTCYASQDWEEKTRPSFCVEEHLFPARQVRRKNASTQNLFPS